MIPAFPKNRIAQSSPEMFTFKSQTVKQAYDYWRSKCHGDRLPSRADIRPSEITRLLPYVYLVDVIGDPPAFRYRLVGTQFYSWTGREYTGVTVDAAEYGPNWENIYKDYCAAVRGRAPVCSEYIAAPWPEREFLTYERIIAPLSDDGLAVNMLFGALDVLPKPAA
jgi:hypothetical protein